MQQYSERRVPVRAQLFSVDSLARDRTFHPNPSKYVVDFSIPFKNVIQVELVQAIYDKFGSDKVINLHIPELDSELETNNLNISSVFAQLPVINPTNLYSGGVSNVRFFRTFERPLSKLGRMTMLFTSYDGSPYSMQDHHLIFEVTTCTHSGALTSNNLGVFTDRSFAIFTPDGAAAPSPPPPLFFHPTN